MTLYMGHTVFMLFVIPVGGANWLGSEELFKPACKA